MIVLDGSSGEGGGQIVRSALALSLLTRQPFRITNIRANREKPGLRHQHLAAVRAAAAVCGAEMRGAEVSSKQLEFSPGEVRAGHYEIPIGTAGSTALVLQTILPALLRAPGQSEVWIEGGTHASQSPPFEFLERTFLAVLQTMGAEVSVRLARHGFYPRGAGRIEAVITGGAHFQPLALVERGAPRAHTAKAILSRLPEHIAQRELRQLERDLGWAREDLHLVQVTDAASAGNAVIVELMSEHLTQVFAGFGEKGVPAEVVAADCALQVRRYLQSLAAVDEHLADQLLIPCVLAGSGEFSAVNASSHLRTNIEVVKAFVDADIRVEQRAEACWRVCVQLLAG